MALTLEIVTPEGKVYAGTVDHVAIPTLDGEVDILSGHIPLLSIVQPGTLKVGRSGNQETLAVDKGFVRVMSDTVSVLTEAAINIEKIDLSEVENAEARAKEALEDARKRNDVDPSKIERLESVVRFSIAQKLAKQKKL